MNLRILNGQVYDPETGKITKRDLFVDGTVMVDAPAEGPDAGTPVTIDAEGCIVTTGLIDNHVHFYNYGTENGVNPDAYAFPCGITTAVDAGSVGAGTYEGYRRTVMSMSDVKIYTQLHMASGGQAAEVYPENQQARYFERGRIRQLFRTYPDNLVGLKLRLSNGVLDPQYAEETLRETIKMAEEVGVNVTVHMSDPCIDSEKLASILRPGDVMCHIFHGKGETILDADGHVRKGIREAQERGVIMDMANGRTNFDIVVGQKAIADGMLPDIISSDINPPAYYLHPLHSLPRIMSKFLDFGMTLEQVLAAVTRAPALNIGHPELATLAAGTPADIAIFKLVQKDVPYTDYNGHTFTGHQVLVPQMTVMDGKVMYCQADFQ